MAEVLLCVENLVKYFPLSRGLFSRRDTWVRAVDGVSFELRKGESLGLVGESGCGKSTVGRLVLRLLEPTSGRIFFLGSDLTAMGDDQVRGLRRHMQIIFQDPYSSLDPRMRVSDIVTEPLRAFGRLSRSQRRERAAWLLERVGLKAADLDRFPHEFSGGQRQRIGIARALAIRPQMIVADEPVSALDVSIQAQVLNLLRDLQEEFGLSYIFISHDLSVVQHVCDRVAVMYLGRIVELAPVEAFSKAPLHPYTRALLGAVPVPDPRRKIKLELLEGDMPSPVSPPPGCAFHPRCPHAMEMCRRARPDLLPASDGHHVACWLHVGTG
jgi:oligopeptide/dipeptide ABC transporter ATP-binding protein